jgi:hypothetical protein
MSGDSISNIDFEYWSILASTDPQKFEQLRQDKISAVIDRATSQRQQRLRGLQWKIDRIREQHKDSATAACLAISELMWETFEHLAELLRAQSESALSAPTPAFQANVIPFPVKPNS